ncbi:hypothetical protein M422DRAFT_783000 [Sphaerobolus stellatus SS14]|uniref:Uncharacterized protein n=1 Tax=Sphaerobolus stellatus (strain SS14) TaxID=990650 RepID=A0A0C9V9D1_SPHS4|nr:hypothetical protein M422DRAFT_783000 [Sphaerobolus stellatus SS14]
MRGGCEARRQIGKKFHCRNLPRRRPRYRHTARKIGGMEDIPDRENLQTMSRIDIQKLCKVWLFALSAGKDVPRPHRAASERGTSQPPVSSRVPSTAQPPSPSKQLVESATKKAALQPSEANTDAESVASAPAGTTSTASTRRKVQAMQMRLGKGKPVADGGNGYSDSIFADNSCSAPLDNRLHGRRHRFVSTSTSNVSPGPV